MLVDEVDSAPLKVNYMMLHDVVWKVMRVLCTSESVYEGA